MYETGLIFLFFFTAMIYSSAGFGGGSTYLALLSSSLVDGGFMRTVAYVCNMIVTGQSNVRFFRKSWVKWSEVWPYFLLSVPLAFLGGMVRLSQGFYLAFLGLVLILAAFWMMLGAYQRRSWGMFDKKWVQIITGGGIGFLSGVVGIGGGIFLAPLLHSSNDLSSEKVAAISSNFIFVNALAGALGFYINHSFSFLAYEAWPLFLAVFMGGMIGNLWTIKGRGRAWIKLLTAILVGLIGLRLFVGNIMTVLTELWS